jgi:ABC-type dipeptide/oligopeptide/nickel transport system permease component
VTFLYDEDEEEAVPKDVDVVSDMYGADYAVYIQYFTWNAEPLGESIFYNTKSVTWDALTIELSRQRERNE